MADDDETPDVEIVVNEIPEDEPETVDVDVVVEAPQEAALPVDVAMSIGERLGALEAAVSALVAVSTETAAHVEAVDAVTTELATELGEVEATIAVEEEVAIEEALESEEVVEDVKPQTRKRKFHSTWFGV